MYIPALKWRQGEYQALHKLSPSAKDLVMPFIEIPPIEWDFETGSEAKTLDSHLELLPRRLENNWGNRAAFLDFTLIDPSSKLEDGTSAASHILNQLDSNITPVITLNSDPDYRKLIKNHHKRLNCGVCIRLYFTDLANPNLNDLISSLQSSIGIPVSNINIFIDLRQPNFDPIDQLAKLMAAKINFISRLGSFRSITICASAFPDSMGKLHVGFQEVPRTEWLLYQKISALLENLKIEIQFGDYCIAHPDIPRLDMRKIKPSASLRYTIDNAWVILKGTTTRKKNGLHQYVDLCKELAESEYFFGEDYSAGDTRIVECYQKKGKNGKPNSGNLTTWRWAGTNHHITKVIEDLSNLSSP